MKHDTEKHPIDLDPQERQTAVYVKAALAGLAAAIPSEPPPAVKALLLTEVRKQRAARPRIQASQWSAVLALAAGLAALYFVGTFRHAPVGTMTITTRAPQPVIHPAAVQPPPVIAPRPVRHTARRVRPATPRTVEDSTAEIATDFIEIPYTEPLRHGQSAEIFRVQMPLANMANYGMPITGVGLDTRVLADVVMGEDGVVRAIRFVH